MRHSPENHDNGISLWNHQIRNLEYHSFPSHIKKIKTSKRSNLDDFKETPTLENA